MDAAAFDVDVDPDILRNELAVTTSEAFDVADRLALEVVDTAQKSPTAFRLARELQEKRLHMHRVERALAVQMGRG